MNKYILFGAGSAARRVFYSLSGLMESVECFVDSNPIRKEFMGRRVCRPEIIRQLYGRGKGIGIVISAPSAKNEIYSSLVGELGVSPKDIHELNEWIASIILDGRIQIRPHKIRLEASTLCQLDCAGCYMRKGNYGSMGGGYLKFQDFARTMDDNPFLHEVELSNSGEPFMNPELEQILDYAYLRNIDLMMVGGANFNTVPDEILEKLAKYEFRHIVCAIDGGSQETYGAYRRKGDFFKVIDNIRKLNRWKAFYHTEYPKLTWAYVLLEQNEKDIEKAKALAEELGMDIRFKLDWSGSFHPKNPEKVKEICGIDAVNIGEFINHEQKAYMSDICRQMIYSPQVNWDGRLLGCCAVYQRDWGTNVFEEGFLSALNTLPYKKAVQSLLVSERMEEGMPCELCHRYQTNHAYGYRMEL